MEKICEKLLNAGIRNFAVATVEEALKLKEIDNKMFFLVCDSYEVSEKGDFS